MILEWRHQTSFSTRFFKEPSKNSSKNGFISPVQVKMKPVDVDQMDRCFIPIRVVLIASVLFLSVCSSTTSWGCDPPCVSADVTRKLVRKQTLAVSQLCLTTELSSNKESRAAGSTLQRDIFLLNFSHHVFSTSVWRSDCSIFHMYSHISTAMIWEKSLWRTTGPKLCCVCLSERTDRDSGCKETLKAATACIEWWRPPKIFCSLSCTNKTQRGQTIKPGLWLVVDYFYIIILVLVLKGRVILPGKGGWLSSLVLRTSDIHVSGK